MATYDTQNNVVSTSDTIQIDDEVVSSSSPQEDTKCSLNGKKAKRKTQGVCPNSLILPPCNVCGYSASGVHFGVIACEACKVSKPHVNFHCPVRICVIIYSFY